MKLRTGRAVYKFPEYSQILEAWVEGNTKHNQLVSFSLCQVSLEDMPSHRPHNEQRGFPTTFCVFGDIIEFWPVPDKPYLIKVRYAPPIEEY